MAVLRQAAKAAFATFDRFLESPSGPRILIYHQVGAGLGRQMEVTVSDFEWQLNWLQRNREVVDLETAIRQWNSPDAEHLVVLSFDDGYEDTYTVAFPLMRDRELAFTLYVSTGMIESGGVDERQALTWEQIESMAASGLMTIGSHTHSHRDLRSVDEREAASELDTADSIIEKRLGFRPRHFAYPWGYWDPVAHELVRRRYETAVLGGGVGRSNYDPHKLYRYPIQLSDGTIFFGARLRGGLLLEERLRRRIRGYSGP